ncbi:MAG: sensor histidine kinase [Gammaproteobacteria bacterium]|nr:sensor histidine kinase [Gammaproteobacteria bacterium]MBV9620934.1 sensor histidine kinase [Gammaproteobacteria bacterium]
MNTDARDRTLYLPDFCTSRATLLIVLIVELTALVLTLARQSVTVDFWTDLVRSSLFLLWIGLTCAALLCLLRRPLARLSVGRASAAVLALIVAVVAAISLCAFLLGRTQLVLDSGGGALFPTSAARFVLRNVWIGFIICGVALRYFYVAHQWRRSIEARAAARVHALQARIRPHFLFNSMNTIAALTRSNPPRAESAVQDLADLFRATLSEQGGTITLAEELEVAHTYQRMEQLRLGERLEVKWQTDALPAGALVPGLIIQPLLENAIYHGIEPRAEGGTVTISGEVNAGLVTIVVRNPLSAAPQMREGNRLALANIRERLTLMYGERALLKSGRFDGEYIVTLRFPLIERSLGARLAAPA